MAITTTSDKFLFVYRFDNGILNLLRHQQLTRGTSTIRFTPDSKSLLVADKTGDCYIYTCEVNEENHSGKWILGHCSIVLDILMTNDSR